MRPKISVGFVQFKGVSPFFPPFYWILLRNANSLASSSVNNCSFETHTVLLALFMIWLIQIIFHFLVHCAFYTLNYLEIWLRDTRIIYGCHTQLNVRFYMHLKSFIYFRISPIRTPAAKMIIHAAVWNPFSVHTKWSRANKQASALHSIMDTLAISHLFIKIFSAALSCLRNRICIQFHMRDSSLSRGQVAKTYAVSESFCVQWH